MRFSFIAILMLLFSGCRIGGSLLGDADTSSSSVAPAGLTFETPAALYITGSQMISINPTTELEDVTYSAPDLPSGMTIDETTGVISGTPVTHAEELISVVVTAENDSGSASAQLIFRVRDGFEVDDFGDASDANHGDGECLTNSGKCTLRAAIEEINALGSPLTLGIMLPSGTYPINLGEISIAADMWIIGQYYFSVVLDGPVAGNRILNMQDGVSLLLANMWLRNGQAFDGGQVRVGQGGAGAELITQTVAFDDGTATNDGGCLYVDANSQIDFTQTSVFRCTAGQSGGGMHLAAGTTAELSVVLISANIAGVFGAGIESWADELTVRGASFTSNNSFGGGGGAGGAVALRGTPAQASVFESAHFEDNTSATGGAFYNVSNTPFECLNCTIYDNSVQVANEGAGICGAADLTHTIVAANNGDNCGAICPGGVAIGGNGYNLEDANDCGLASTGDLINTDPLLGDLEVVGAIFGRYPLTGSPAIDSGDNSLCSTIDLIFASRKGDCDRGALSID